jgi:hypothetical protein
MKHLIHTIVLEGKSGDILKYEIFFWQGKLDYYGKVPEGKSRVIASKLDISDQVFKITDSDLSLIPLYEANKPTPNTWYSDGPERVNLEMVIEYLKKIS